MFTLASITATLLATAAAIRSFRAVINQTLLAIPACKAVSAELPFEKKPSFSRLIGDPRGKGAVGGANCI
jgi:hypothetical protein